jgi:regulatory protein
VAGSGDPRRASVRARFGDDRADPHAHEAVLNGTPAPDGPRRRPSIAERRERKAAIDDPALVLEAAARFLEPRARSVTEVRRRLTGAGYRVDLVDGAIERLLELGVLDDEAFARAWVESRDRARPRGERALRQELGLKGIDRSTVDLVLAERREAAAGAPDDEGDVGSVDQVAAERLLARNARSLSRVADPRQRRQRAYALLARNGFDPEVCRTVAAMVADDPVDADGGV